MWLRFTCLLLVAAAERNWQSLRDGLTAWEALGFDEGILYVAAGHSVRCAFYGM